MNAKSGKVLLIEDNEDDVVFVRLAFSKIGIESSLMTVSDGRQAISYLRGSGFYADREEYPMPVFILLDLQLPVVSGFEVLEWVRARKRLKRLPITVFTGWDSPGDVTRAYELGANSCVAKPLKFDEFNATVTNIAEFWLKWAKLPQVNANTFPSLATRHVAQ